MFGWFNTESLVAPAPGCVNAKLIEKVLLARKVGRFLSKDQDEAERQVVEGVARALAADVSNAVREALAFELRLCRSLPRDIADKLARDIEDVASPFLQETTSFSTDQLAEIVSVVDEFAKVAIARRRDVPAEVSLALASFGGEKAVKTLVRNTTADMPEAACMKVVDRFPEDSSMMDALSFRDNLPLSVVGKLVNLVSEKARTSLVTHYHVNGEIADRVTRGAEIRGMADMLAKASRPQIERYAHDLHRRDRLDDNMILDLVRAGSLAFFEAAMALRIGIPTRNVQLILQEHRSTGLSRLLERAHVNTALHDGFRDAVEFAIREAEAIETRLVRAH